jgi:hypothetical protein
MAMQGDGRSVPNGPGIWVRGSVVATATAGEPEPDAAEPQRQLAWVSAHGGAGASTLATVLGGVDIGHRWPEPGRDEPRSVVLVARTHAAGLQAVSRKLDLFRRGELPPGVEIVAVVLVADAPGRLPRELSRRIKVIGSAVTVYQVPWVPVWRTGNLDGPLPRDVVPLSRLLGGPSRSQ